MNEERCFCLRQVTRESLSLEQIFEFKTMTAGRRSESRACLTKDWPKTKSPRLSNINTRYALKLKLNFWLSH